MDKKLLTTQETAELLGLSDGRIRRMILDGIIPAQKFGRVNMIKKSDADKIKVHGKVGRPAKTEKTEKPPKK
jgi:excisionase family DNA binding protein